MSPRFIKQLLAFLFLAAGATTPVLADLSWYIQNAPETTYSTPGAACSAFESSLSSAAIAGTSISSTVSYSSSTSYYCVVTIKVDATGATWYQTQAYIFKSGDGCTPPAVYTPQVDGCVAPEPPPECPAGATWDPFSEPPRCTFPQDDACGAIGAHWDPAASSCQCDSQTDALVTAAGVTRCMKLRDDSCTKDSPDFKGYGPRGQGVCDGRASCPDGGVPGYVGAGDTMSAICYKNPQTPDPTCNGQSGVKDGKKVCIPYPGKDPDFPDCSGVVGTGTDGKKVCIHKPDDHPDCKPGEQWGYFGPGENSVLTCIDKSYQPQTCPPGQYVINQSTGGFGCAKADGQQKPDSEGNVPGKATGTPGKSTGTSTTTKKDAEGNVTGTEESEIKLDFTDLLQDQPNTDFKGEMDAFSDSVLDDLDTDSLIGEFDGADGAFTERNSLNNIGNFLKSHTVGTSTSCSGSLPFFGRVITCEKFATYNRIIGWMIFIYTLIHIYNVIMRKPESGV